MSGVQHTNVHSLIGIVVVFCITSTASLTCPKPLDIQTDFVKKNFNVTKFQGVWYELAYHDVTQPIGICGCERSVKTYHADTNFIFDNFTLLCAGLNQFNNLTFNLTGKVYHYVIPLPREYLFLSHGSYVVVINVRLGSPRGHMIGRWPFLKSVDFPNTVVAVGLNKTGAYDWVIEFQCVEVLDEVIFTGINFYNRKRIVPSSELEIMLTTARKQGLGYWMDHGLKVHIVDHSNCTYPPVVPGLSKHWYAYNN